MESEFESESESVGGKEPLISLAPCPLKSLSKFNIASIVMDTLTDKTHSVHQNVFVKRIKGTAHKNFDADGIFETQAGNAKHFYHYHKMYPKKRKLHGKVFDPTVIAPMFSRLREF